MPSPFTWGDGSDPDLEELLPVKELPTVDEVLARRAAERRRRHAEQVQGCGSVVVMVLGVGLLLVGTVAGCGGGTLDRELCLGGHAVLVGVGLLLALRRGAAL